MASFASVSSDPNSPVYSPVAGDEIFHDAPTHQMPPPPTTAKRGIRTAAGTSIPWARIHEVHTSQLRGHLRFLKMIAESKGYTAKVSEFIARTEILISDAEALKPTIADLPSSPHTTTTRTAQEKRRRSEGVGRQSSKRPKTKHRPQGRSVSVLGKRPREEEVVEAGAEEPKLASPKKQRTAYMTVDPADLPCESDDSDSDSDSSSDSSSSDSDSKEAEEEAQPPAPGKTEPEVIAPQKKRAGETQEESRASSKKQRRKKGLPGGPVAAARSPKRGAQATIDEGGKKRLRIK